MLTKILYVVGAAHAWRPHLVVPGKCPDPDAGELQSKIKTLDVKRLQGVWYSLWDEKKINEDYTCMATKIGDLVQGNDHIFEFSQSNAITDMFFKQISKDHPNSHNYWTHEGRVLNFDHQLPTIANIDFT